MLRKNLINGSGAAEESSQVWYVAGLQNGGSSKMSWGEFYIWTVWAMAGLNLLTGIGCFWNNNWEHGGMFVSYAVACVFIVFQVTKATVR